MEIIRYTPALDKQITNLNALPRGTGARYLECIRGQDGKYVAKKWCKRAPASYEVLISFTR